MRTDMFGLTATLVAASLALTLSACDDLGVAPAGDARVSVLLTDGPGQLERAWVEITGIYLQGRAEGAGDFGHESGNFRRGRSGGGPHGPGAEGERVWLLDGSTGYVDLLELDDETLQLVDEVVIPAGTYAQLRILVGAAAVVTDEGKVFATPGADLSELPVEGVDGTVHCPSCSQTGIKVRLQRGAVEIAGATQVLVLDFDVRQTFGHEAGHSDRWVMHPMVIASDFQTGGTISGKVTLAEEVTMPTCGDVVTDLTYFTPLASDGDEIEKTGIVVVDGTYTISFVPPGDYTMDYVGSTDVDSNGTLWTLNLEATIDPTTVTVGSGGMATADYTITEATCTS